MKLTKVQSMFFSIDHGLTGLSIILTVYAGSVGVIEGTLTFGKIAEFIIYVNMLTWPVAVFGLDNKFGSTRRSVTETVSTNSSTRNEHRLRTKPGSTD